MLKLLSYLKPYWKAALMAPLCMLLEVMMDLFQPTLMARIINIGIANLDLPAIWRTGGLMLLVAVIGMFGGIGCAIASSSVDTRTEQHIQEAMLQLMQGRTSFVIAHRLATIRKADCILVMQDGELVERGTHEELLNKRGHYHRLYTSQFA